MFSDELSQEKFSLEYTDVVPKDYDVSEIQYTFDFISLVLKEDSTIEDAVREVCGKYDLSETDFRNYLIENKYILGNANADDFSKLLKKYNTKSLKKILKKNGLKTSGKREHIEKRIFENGLIGESYHLSSKSKVFYKNKKRRITIFNAYLTNYYFREFNEFYMDNYRKKEVNIPIEFINSHINKAIEDKSHRNYIFNTQIMAEHFYKKENYKEMLRYALRSYCMNLNPIWKIDELKNHSGLSRETYDQMLFLQKKLGKNRVISTYYVIWDSFVFENIIVSKYDGYRCLKDMLNLKDYERIVADLENRFYENDDLKIKKITQKTLFDF
ncbi:SAP domain-containing protein [uncultured Methanobrevibacter sp.]|uniref:SAP domain-containing protein n=1 Tax=uncultured Methanobrevibacter sp. TaxID=253161 RepID=UPI0025D95EA9|nr:SAP domain-containing protein [uncultured Methanobrevibacter sp.]